MNTDHTGFTSWFSKGKLFKPIDIQQDSAVTMNLNFMLGKTNEEE